jgi:glc operon protein GlcG
MTRPKMMSPKMKMLLAFAIALSLLGIGVRNASAQFVEKKTLSLAAAKKMAAAAEAEATKNNWTMVISVLDDGGNLLLLERMDGTQLGSIEVSQGKARTALQFKRPSKAFQDLIDKDQQHLITLGHITGVQGGLPIMAEGKVVGSIGASGGTSAQDEQCAQAGLNALGAQ